MAALLRGVCRYVCVITDHRSLLVKCSSVNIKCMRFMRGLRRRPVAVLYPGDKQYTPIKPPRDQERTSTVPNKQHNKTGGQKTGGGQSPDCGQSGLWKKSGVNQPGLVVDRCSVKEKLGGLRFDKALPGDQRLGKLVSIARSRVFREQEGKVLLEGKRLICDALAAGASPQVLFFSRVERLLELPLEKLGQASLVKVKFEDIKIWSDLVTPQGLIAIFSKPDESQLQFPEDLRSQSIPLFLICDNVRDPGSLGTILRCAAAAGCDRVLLTRGCVDPWEPKVLRAAVGAHFRLPIVSGLDWDAVLEHLPRPVTVHVADDASRNMRGSEAEVQKSGQSLEEYIESDSDDDDDEQFLPCIEQKVHYENWAERSTALVISGETHGPSSEALQLARETDGYKLFVPFAPGVELLGSAMMASVLLFEGRRQMMKLAQRGKSSAHSS